jgi:hypothetical protein
MEEFTVHNFFARWQEKEFKHFLKNIPPETVVSCIDFSENYGMKVQNEIQSMHWYMFQITVLVYIAYMWNPDYRVGGSEPEILKETHYYMSDEPQHDTFLVQHAFLLQWKFMTDRGIFPKQHVVWSDECAGQFKSARSWLFLGRYHNLTMCDQCPTGCQVVWNYFATGHGKGEVDGVVALMKRELRKEQIKLGG